MRKICKQCGEVFDTPRGNKVFCKRECKDQYRNNAKPRKTSKSYKDAKATRNIALTYTQRQIILGGLLGDGSININNVFLMTHSYKQKEYLDWKIQALGGLVQAKASKYTRSNGNVQYHAHTIKHPELEELRSIVYPLGKKVVGEWVKELGLEAIAVWYMDDGSSSKSQRQCVFCTESFQDEEQNLLIDLLGSYGVEASKLTYFDKRYGRERTRLIIGSESTIKLKTILAPYIPACMAYKIE